MGMRWMLIALMVYVAFISNTKHAIRIIMNSVIANIACLH